MVDTNLKCIGLRLRHKQQHEAKTQTLTTLQHGLWQQRALVLRHVPMGSLGKIMREYFACFEYGLASVVATPRLGRRTRASRAP